MTTRMGVILAEATSSGYAVARAKALKILREEGNLDLAKSVIFIENLKRQLSYQAAAQELEKLANKADTLESKRNFYSQAEEEYKKFDSQKSSDMRAKVEGVQRQISELYTKIGTAQQEADRLTREGKWSDAEQEIERALLDFNKIGLQKISNARIELSTKKSEYRTAIDLSEKIEKEKDIRKLDNLKEQIKAELTGHKKLEFLVLKRRYELKEEELKERLTKLQNPGRWEKISNFRKSQEEKDTEIEILKKLFNIAKEEREGLKEEESEEQRKEREKGLRSSIINETAGILSNAKTNAARIGKEAGNIAVERVALARIINERRRYIQSQKEREKERLTLQVRQAGDRLAKASGIVRNAAIEALYKKEMDLKKVDEELKHAITEVTKAGKQLQNAENNLKSVGLTLETVKEQIAEKENFYKNNQKLNLDTEFQTKSREFTSKVEEFKDAEGKVSIIQRVNSQTEGMKDIYEKAKEEIERREEVFIYIDGLALSDTQKEEYKGKVLDYKLDLDGILRSAKSVARAEQENKLKRDLEPLKLDGEKLSEAIGKLSEDGANCDEVISQTRAEYVENTKTFLRKFVTLTDSTKEDFIKELAADGSNGAEIIDKARSLGQENNKKVKEAKDHIDTLKLSREKKDEFKAQLMKDGTNIEEVKAAAIAAVVVEEVTGSEESDDKTDENVKEATSEEKEPKVEETAKKVEEKKEELKVEVIGNRIYIENNKKIKKESRTVALSDINGTESIVVRGKEVFLHEFKKNKNGETEIIGYGILPKLNSNNERVLARLYDRVIEGRERKEEEEIKGNGEGEDKGSQLFEKIGHLSVAEAYEYVRKEVRGLSLIPNIVMSVGSDEERKYVYKNMGERGEVEENKIWIEGINEVKNYGEDENSVGKYSDNKVGTIIGYGREVGEGKYVGMYMKGSKHEIKQGAGNIGEVVNVGLGINGKYENKVEIKWLTYVGMNKCKTERGWEEGNAKGEFSMGEVGIDVEWKEG